MKEMLKAFKRDTLWILRMIIDKKWKKRYLIKWNEYWILAFFISHWMKFKEGEV